MIRFKFVIALKLENLYSLDLIYHGIEIIPKFETILMTITIN